MRDTEHLVFKMLQHFTAPPVYSPLRMRTTRPDRKGLNNTARISDFYFFFTSICVGEIWAVPNPDVTFHIPGLEYALFACLSTRHAL